MQIKSKQEFYSLWIAGVLGNRPAVFTDVHEALKLGAPTVGFREIGKAGGGAFELVPRDKALETAQRWQAAGRKYCLDSAVPNPAVTLLGEVCRTERGLQGFLGVRTGMHMRASIAAGLLKHRGYLETKVLMDHFMDPASRDDIDTFLELFPDATIEFACFPMNVGIIPGRNTIIWEVRDY